MESHPTGLPTVVRIGSMDDFFSDCKLVYSVDPLQRNVIFFNVFTLKRCYKIYELLRLSFSLSALSLQSRKNKPLFKCPLAKRINSLLKKQSHIS